MKYQEVLSEITKRTQGREKGPLVLTHQTVTRQVREGLCPVPDRTYNKGERGKSSEYAESTPAFIFAAHSMMFGRPRYPLDHVVETIKKLRQAGPYPKGVFVVDRGGLGVSDDVVSGWGQESADRDRYLNYFLGYFETMDDENEIAAAGNRAISDVWSREWAK